MNERSNKNIAFLTFGCAKNEVDTQHMKQRIDAAGYTLCDDYASAQAIVVNTCAFIQEATEESLDGIFELAGLSGVKSKKTRLIVAGCMPSRYGDDLAAELNEASDFVPFASEENIVSILDDIFGIQDKGNEGKPSNAQLQLDAPVSAYVKISDGCDRNCSFCTIPQIRGHYESFSLASIEAEVKDLVSRGTREIIFIAQDTGKWGSDFQEKSTLANLMKICAEDFPDTWFRVMYIQPEHMTDDLIEVVGSHSNICNYFDIPLQHVNADILKAMNRKGSGIEFRRLIDHIRAKIPGVCLRTTFIAGFPGETEENFDELCAFIEDTDLDYIGVFPYSREEGTPAADLPCQIPDDEKLRRAQYIRDLADSICTAKVSRRIGSEADVLILGREEDGEIFGRTYYQAPEVDGVTYLKQGKPATIVRCRIVDTLFYEMEAE
ncbi:MAG: 30S ribosomal protein S12 methylthiotransferase RimO [Eggerthellaceae bacterium]|jgi:ribosomal protein S12 methylthiotransferase